MSARTGELAADVAWARPPAIPVALICGYNGSARPSAEQVAAWGRPFLCGFESDVVRSYAGGDAGEADAAFSCRSFDELGYPRECGSWVCAADASSTPAQYLANVTEYGRRYALRMIAGGRPGPLLAYGNPAAVEAMVAGFRAAGVTGLRWGVGTWGYGEGRGPNQPPAEADVELLQSGNTPGPADGTDLDWLYAPVDVFRAWGGPAPSEPVTPSRKKPPKMWIAHVASTHGCDLWTETPTKLRYWQNTDTTEGDWGIGATLRGYMAQGVTVVTYPTLADYQPVYNDLMRQAGHPDGPGVVH